MTMNITRENEGQIVHSNSKVTTFPTVKRSGLVLHVVTLLGLFHASLASTMSLTKAQAKIIEGKIVPLLTDLETVGLCGQIKGSQFVIMGGKPMLQKYEHVGERLVLSYLKEQEAKSLMEINKEMDGEVEKLEKEREYMLRQIGRAYSSDKKEQDYYIEEMERFLQEKAKCQREAKEAKQEARNAKQEAQIAKEDAQKSIRGIMDDYLGYRKQLQQDANKVIEKEKARLKTQKTLMLKELKTKQKLIEEAKREASRLQKSVDKYRKELVKTQRRKVATKQKHKGLKNAQNAAANNIMKRAKEEAAKLKKDAKQTYDKEINKALQQRKEADKKMDEAMYLQNLLQQLVKNVQNGHITLDRALNVLGNIKKIPMSTGLTLGEKIPLRPAMNMPGLGVVA